MTKTIGRLLTLVFIAAIIVAARPGIATGAGRTMTSGQNGLEIKIPLWVVDTLTLNPGIKDNPA
jgi:hypothetical protein